MSTEHIFPVTENLASARSTYVDYLECSTTGKQYPPQQVYGLSEAGKPLLVRYRLEEIAGNLSRSELSARLGDLWKYRELLPVQHRSNIVSLGESDTPLILLSELGSPDGEIWIKDEGRLPASSFKARGIAMAVSMAKELGITRIAMPTNGNAGAALAAYGSRAGIETYIFCPADTPEINIREIAQAGGNVFRVDGLIDRCGQIVAEGTGKMGWFDMSTLKEPYRIEGKKTMGLELVEQLGWQVPDIIFYPTGGGTGLIGMWKAFDELATLGWINPDRRPRMVAVQASGCAPIVHAWEQGESFAQRVDDAQTVAAGIRVPQAVGDFLILEAVRESNGFAIAVSDEDILHAQAELGKKEGLLTSPEGAATLAAYWSSLQNGQIDGSERAVLFNCGNGLKYPMPAVEGPTLTEVDWNNFSG